MDRRHYPVAMRSAKLKKVITLTLLLALALILFGLESFLPQPIPGGKIGLSQLVTLLVLVWFGWVEALSILLLRVLLGNLILGSFLNPVFLMGVAGAIVSLPVMALTYYHCKAFGIVGISIWGAVFHNTAQMLMAYLLFVRKAELFWLIPYFIWVSLISGFLIGLFAWLILSKIPASSLVSSFDPSGKKIPLNSNGEVSNLFLHQAVEWKKRKNSPS